MILTVLVDTEIGKEGKQFMGLDASEYENRIAPGSAEEEGQVDKDRIIRSPKADIAFHNVKTELLQADDSEGSYDCK